MMSVNFDDLNEYDYDLPRELIAQHPLPQRDAARLMVVSREREGVTHRQIRDLPELLRPGDCLVLNNTRVIPARLFGTREATGGRWEGLFLETDETGHWKLIGHTRGRLQEGERIVLQPAHADHEEHRSRPEARSLKLLSRDSDGIWTVAPEFDVPPLKALHQFGTVPLPPYIRRTPADPTDFDDYQTVFASHPGAVAAPTAGLHLTEELLTALQRRGIETACVTLHVGIGTFRPIGVENLAEHRMHAEWCRLTPEVAERLNTARSRGGRIIAVGTTAVRTLESAVEGRKIKPVERKTDLFIRPPYSFGAVDGLLTNFHLPKSSLLVLVSAFLGVEQTRAAYAEAVRERYRFYSYGDAMLILPEIPS